MAPMKDDQLSRLSETARRVRIGTVVSIYHAGSGHPGGALSAADLLAYLWSHELTYRPNERTTSDQNRFVLSKGHACPALYAAAAEAGLISHALLPTLRKLGSPLQGHPHVLDLPWTENSTGSLGQGLSFSLGLAFGLQRKGSRARVYVMLGDGELQEGEVWEAAMFAGHYNLDNVCAILDYNKMQSDDLNEHIMGLEPLGAKWTAFNWHVQEIDGHDFRQIDQAFEHARRLRGKPSMVIAHTRKGRGVSYMEGSPLWHGSVRLRDEDLRRALLDLGEADEDFEGYRTGSIWA